MGVLINLLGRGIGLVQWGFAIGLEHIIDLRVDGRRLRLPAGAFDLQIDCGEGGAVAGRLKHRGARVGSGLLLEMGMAREHRVHIGIQAFQIIGIAMHQCDHCVRFAIGFVTVG